MFILIFMCTRVLKPETQLGYFYFVINNREKMTKTNKKAFNQYYFTNIYF